MALEELLEAAVEVFDDSAPVAECADVDCREETWDERSVEVDGLISEPIIVVSAAVNKII